MPSIVTAELEPPQSLSSEHHNTTCSEPSVGGPLVHTFWGLCDQHRTQSPRGGQPAHLFLEAHGRDVTPHTSIFLVVAALRLGIEFAVYEGLLIPGALNFVEVDGSYPWGRNVNMHYESF